MSNLKQIGLGMLQYTQDFDETVVAQRYGNASCGGQSGGNAYTRPSCGTYKWMDAIFPYVKSSQLFTCPSTKTNDPNTLYEPLSTLTGAQTSNRYGSYAINVAYSTVGDAYTPPISVQSTAGTFDLRKVSAITVPSTTMVLTDGSLNDYMMYFDTSSLPSFSIVSGVKAFGSSARLIYERHLETCPVLYADGHVKAVKMDSLADKNAGVYSNFTIEDD